MQSQVALHVSAWVEISSINFNVDSSTVALHVSAWVEIYFSILVFYKIWVALHVSAWVEIVFGFRRSLSNQVALHVSAWVEIALWTESCWISILSHSTWVRELKLHSDRWLHERTIVALHVSAWVEMKKAQVARMSENCRTPRECVSWNGKRCGAPMWKRSHSTWVRELKSSATSSTAV